MSNSDLTTQDATRPTDLATLANEINGHLDRAAEAATTAMEHARECGELLNQAKDEIGHGSFIPWLEANCRVKPRQAQKLMRLAREWPAIEAKCAFDAHLTIDGVLRLLASGERQMQQEPAEVAERRTTDPPMAGSGDPFDVEDPFGVSGEREEDGTDAGGQEDQELPPPDANGSGTETSGGPSRTPAEEFKIQKAKTVKTAEALMRAVDDLQGLKPARHHEQVITMIQGLLPVLQNWPKG